MRRWWHQAGPCGPEFRQFVPNLVGDDLRVNADEAAGCWGPVLAWYHVAATKDSFQHCRTFLQHADGTAVVKCCVIKPDVFRAAFYFDSLRHT